MEGQQQETLVTPGPSSSHSPTIKSVEVTAKQIVDRINSMDNQSSADQGGEGLSGIGKLLTGLETYQAGKEDTNNSNNEEATRRQSLSKGPAGRQMSISSADGHVSAEQKAVEQLLEAVQKWVREAQAETESTPEKHIERDLDNLHWVYSIESYLRSLNTDWTSQKTLTHKIASQLLLWMRQLFHLAEGEKGSDEYNSIHTSWEVNGGMAAVTQMSLYLKFPNLYSQGYQYFQDECKTPIIYCSDDMIGQQICSKVGLPYTSISVIDFTDRTWVENLDSRIKSDIQSGKVPVALLMNTAVQNLEKGVKLAESYRVWVHFYGNNVLAYFMKRPESSHLGSSFTLDMTRWLKSPKLPYLTLYKRPEKVEARVLEICDLGSPRNEINCFTPWFVCHVFGKTRLTALVNEAIYRGKFMLEMVQRYEALHVVPNWSSLSDGHVILSTLTFQFNPSSKSQSRRSSSASPSGKQNDQSKSPSTQYIDTLNSWLYHIMERDLRDVLPLEFVFVESRGWNIHVDIIRSRKLTPNDEAAILATFENHMQVLSATVNQKIKFQKLVEECEELEWVNNEQQWAGLGAVRYVPSIHRKSDPTSTDNVEKNGSVVLANGTTEGDKKIEKKVEKLSKEEQEKFDDKIKEDIDHLNAKIVDKLKSIDSAFSLGKLRQEAVGEAPVGDWCVQFGMVTEETDVQELVRLVVSTGSEIEESSEFFDRMSELVRKGIHEAEEELKRESEDALWEEGILRRVPIVGTFVSWFSPPMKESGVRGRALNLTQGKVESTENIYKYHMQVEASTFSTNKGQPAVTNQRK